MKAKVLKVVLVVLVCMSCAASGAHAATGVFKLGLDLGGQHEATLVNFDASETFDVDNGFSLALEIEGNVHKNFDLGFGLEVQSARKLSDYEGKFSFLPIYLLVKVHPEASDLTPYFIGQLGVALFNGDDQYAGTAGTTNSGGHVGIGGGLAVNNEFQFELLFTADSGSITYPSPLNVFDVDVVYTKTTLSMGFRF